MLISPPDAPKLPSVSESPSAEIVEGSSVTLTCSSDANPAANYTWYKKNGDPDLHPLSKEPQLVFSSIQSSDSGEYYCTAENELGRRTSEYIYINVTYAPKLPSVSVSPSAEILEGSSVTLTCSSDANPAANYTWYKEKQKLLQSPEGSHYLTSVSSEDGGNYSCKAQNQHGQTSSSVFIDVQCESHIPPKSYMLVLKLISMVHNSRLAPNMFLCLLLDKKFRCFVHQGHQICSWKHFTKQTIFFTIIYSITIITSNKKSLTT
uniref:Ig-like domain-containing protein n=1 Tax=Sparus aurata TaxID=8175 RepID=A0A671TE81_SPAAU